MRRTRCRRTIVVLLDLKDTIDSVNRTALISALPRSCMPAKFANLLRALHLHTYDRVRKISGVHQQNPILFKFVIEGVMKNVLDL